LVENIVDPSKVISDQYESSILTLKNGSTVIGRITSDEGGILQVATNPAAPGQTTDVRHDTIQSRQVSPTSLMPPGLINAMNADEVADLLAYILSGGDKRGKMFKK
ncbi:MAG: heme-binding protein, partial [Prosthecobacter sp.]